MEDKPNVLVIGGGIVGLATAYQIAQGGRDRRVCVLEKEQELVAHQTGHNSGVIHSGIYYRPGSLKAKNCREGKLALQMFCESEGIPYEMCGKVIVAVAEEELPRLQALYDRGKANGVRCAWLDPGGLREREPHCRGLRAIHVPEAGIVDYRMVGERLADKLRAGGNQIETRTRVLSVEERPDQVIVHSTRGDYTAPFVINCGGLHSDRVTAFSGAKPSARIIPFRGEYYALRAKAKGLCRNLIYPVPDPRFPFLGVHFTRRIGGGVDCGPNAVLAFAREGYRRTSFNLRDLWETLGYRGFHKLAARYWRTGLEEMWRSMSKAAFLKSLQRLVPEVRSEDLSPAPAGVRAQALSPSGDLVDDFAIQESRRVLHVINAPSPAATSCLSVGKLIAERLRAHS